MDVLFTQPEDNPMTVHKVYFSSKSTEWPTPVRFFQTLDDEFNFTLDPCATHENAKCSRYFTYSDNGLAQDWSNERVFCNPPYGQAISDWAKKCHQESLNGALVVLLVPARTDTRWFHDWVFGKSEIRFVKGRLKFGDGKGSAPFASILAIYRPNYQAQQSQVVDFDLAIAA